MSVDETPGQESLVHNSRCDGEYPSNCLTINRVHEPRIIWIGCSDARVPESVMLRSTWICKQRCRCTLPPVPGCQCPVPAGPGCQCQPLPSVFPAEQFFVQRNIANQLHLTDNNAVSVLSFAGITNSPIKEVRIVGHTDCGGVKACYNAVRPGPNSQAIAPDSVLWAWLGPLRDLAARHMDDSIDQLAVRNVRVQVKNAREVLGRLRVPSEVLVKGYLYNVKNGTLEPVPESGNQ